MQANLVAELVVQLVQRGVEPASIGVICFYRAQVCLQWLVPEGIGALLSVRIW